MASWGRLAAGLDYQNHAGMEDGDITVAALEGGDGGFVGGCDRVEGFATLYGVMEHGALACSRVGGAVL
jgi:hypothetical protein